MKRIEERKTNLCASLTPYAKTPPTIVGGVRVSRVVVASYSIMPLTILRWLLLLTHLAWPSANVMFAPSLCS